MERSKLPVIIAKRTVYHYGLLYSTDFYNEKNELIHTMPANEKQLHKNSKTIRIAGNLYQIKWVIAQAPPPAK